MKSYKPKWVNSILYIIGVNSLRLGGLHLSYNLTNYDHRIISKTDNELNVPVFIIETVKI